MRWSNARARKCTVRPWIDFAARSPAWGIHPHWWRCGCPKSPTSAGEWTHLVPEDLQAEMQARSLSRGTLEMLHERFGEDRVGVMRFSARRLRTSRSRGRPSPEKAPRNARRRSTDEFKASNRNCPTPCRDHPSGRLRGSGPDTAAPIWARLTRGRSQTVRPRHSGPVAGRRAEAASGLDARGHEGPPRDDHEPSRSARARLGERTPQTANHYETVMDTWRWSRSPSWAASTPTGICSGSHSSSPNPSAQGARPRPRQAAGR